MAAAKQVLLLDFDGVILRNRNLMAYQAQKSAKFVQHHTHLHRDTCERINQKWYPHFGHTVTMLNEVFHKRVALAEYNSYVFNPVAIKRLNNLVDNETAETFRAYEKVFEACLERGWDWRVFTNAHVDWVMHFSNLFASSITEDKIIWPKYTTEMKPYEDAYANCEAMMPDAAMFLLVDDSPTNLVHPKNRIKWVPLQWGMNDNPTGLCNIIYTVDDALKKYDADHVCGIDV